MNNLLKGRVMEKVDSEVLSIKNLFTDRIYTLGYFQRGYSWKQEHIHDLIDDLMHEFHSHQVDNTQKISSYFLGSIIVNADGGTLSLIDGQQRLTSLSLIFIWLANECPNIKEEIASLIFKQKEDTKICTLDVPDRTDILEDLYHSRSMKNDKNLTVANQNIKKRFEDIKNIFFEKKLEKENALNFFKWLKNHVSVVQITTKSKKDAYKIFESANDRGLKLTPLEMLKSYLLSQIDDESEQSRLDKLWVKRIDELANMKEEEEAIKSWLRAVYAKSDNDFESIGGEFHRWLKDNVEAKKINLKESKDFIRFIEEDFEFYTRWYIKLKNAAKNYSTKHEALFCNEKTPFTPQYYVILSTLKRSDSESTIWKKVKLVTSFIDIYIAHHLWNDLRAKLSQRQAKIPMNKLAINIRHKDLSDILEVLLLEKIGDSTILFSISNRPRKLNDCRKFLVRFSAYLDKEMGLNDSNLELYYNAKKYNVEHIMPEKYTRDYESKINKDTNELEFENEEEFNAERNRFGALLLLHESTNKSLGKKPYKEKISIYATQDMILAKIMSKSSYDSNPNLRKLAERYNFTHHDEFLKAEIKEREKLYTRIANDIWNIEKLKEIANSDE